jgi:hypothetical protein
LAKVARVPIFGPQVPACGAKEGDVFGVFLSIEAITRVLVLLITFNRENSVFVALFSFV